MFQLLTILVELQPASDSGDLSLFSLGCSDDTPNTQQDSQYFSWGKEEKIQHASDSGDLSQISQEVVRKTLMPLA